MLEITCRTNELANRAKEITEDFERWDFPELCNVEVKIEIGEFNSIEGCNHIPYTVATLYNTLKEKVDSFVSQFIEEE